MDECDYACMYDACIWHFTDSISETQKARDLAFKGLKSCVLITGTSFGEGRGKCPSEFDGKINYLYVCQCI